MSPAFPIIVSIPLLWSIRKLRFQSSDKGKEANVIEDHWQRVAFRDGALIYIYFFNHDNGVMKFVAYDDKHDVMLLVTMERKQEIRAGRKMGHFTTISPRN